MNNALNEIARTRPNVVVNAPDVLPEQSHTHKLGADKHEQHGEQHEDAVTRPGRTKKESQHDQHQREGEAGERYQAADLAEQSQRRGGQTGHQVVHQVNQPHKAVFRIAKSALGMDHRQLNGVSGKGVGQDRNRRRLVGAGA